MTNTEKQRPRNGKLPIHGVSNSSFDDEKIMNALFEEYNKAYRATKEGQHFPEWFNDEQLKWIFNVIKNCC